MEWSTCLQRAPSITKVSSRHQKLAYMPVRFTCISRCIFFAYPLAASGVASKIRFCSFFLAALTLYPWPCEMNDAHVLAATVAPNFMMSERMQNMELRHHTGL